MPALNLLAAVPADATVVARACFSDALDDAPVDAAVLRRLGFEGKADQLQVLPDGDGLLLLVGLGERAKVGPAALRKAGAQLTKAARKHPRLTVAVLEALAAPTSGREEPAGSGDEAGREDEAGRGDQAGGDDRSGAAAEAVTSVAALQVEAQALVEGLLLAAYEYGGLKSEPSKTQLADIDVVAPADGARAGADRGRVLAEAVAVTRNLVNEPGGSLTAPRFARKAAKLARKHGFEAKVHKRRDLVELGFGGLLGVNRGSAQPPRFVELRYRPKGEARGTVALVGKGITFDSGGLSLKTGAGMMTMKCDMAGAAAVLGAFVAIARLRPDVEVRGYLPMTDNMTGGDASRPGDVFTIRNGKTIEVLNTDAEGRLILADALAYASESKPDAMIDLATLTGACVTALGNKVAGLMGRGDGWLTQVEEAATTSGEQVWRLPMPPEYRKQYESSVADMKNIGSGSAGALVAGLILGEFVDESVPWAHLDIAGPAFTDSEDAEITKGGTGYGVRLLVELVERFTPPATAAGAAEPAEPAGSADR
ncbi:MAG: leucyl aminopeptidase [Acidimicrobiia bacterium]